jgi:hypothetical protein
MTSASFLRRLAMLAAVASSFWLAACGNGGSGGGSSNIRAINLTDNLASLDLYVGGTKQFTGLNTGALAPFASLDANSYTVNVNSTGNSAALFTGTYTLSKDAHYTAVVWGPQTSLHVTALPEDDDTTLIGTGNTRVRMFNATTTTGTLDVYLTAPGADLTASTPTQGLLTAGSLSGFQEIPAGTYELRVTGKGNPSDLRLDIPSVTVNAAQYETIVLTAGSGGALVNGTMIVEQGAATAMANTQARVRVVASVDSLGAVSANVGGTLIANNLSSPAVGAYTLVPASNATDGDPALRLLVNGNPTFTGAIPLAAGGDYTLLAWGTAATPQLTTITDDNRLPLSTSQTKIRLVNGVQYLDPLTMLVDFGAVSGSQNIVAGQAAPYTNVTSNPTAAIEVDSATLGTVFPVTAPTNGYALTGQGVYTVFVLSGKAAPVGTLRNERP